jgi:hypothetical protein
MRVASCSSGSGILSLYSRYSGELVYRIALSDEYQSGRGARSSRDVTSHIFIPLLFWYFAFSVFM